MHNPYQMIRVLLVDDERDFLASTAQALTRRGFRVTTADSGTAALRLLEGDFFDAVVLDVKMPDVDGLEVFRQVHGLRPQLPVILLTGYASAAQAAAAAESGVAVYLAKPCEIGDLVEHIRNALGARRVVDENGFESAAMEEVSVLLVDDEDELIAALSPVLRRRGMTVSAASGGEEALRVLRESFVDVVVLDLKMPGMDGLAALRHMKREFPDVEIVIMTGHPSADSAVQTIKAGASEYLMKPPDTDELVGAIRKVFRRRRQRLEQKQQRLIDEVRKRYPE
ncbi:MAG TPA: response regulator [candidate division Zixibacteria bacterium]|nr:response regulator [candidate division Zixibacteria bacterium]MDD4917961.1 response regulator [candidate division Zixibacteria bacterium]MDM7972487.1 response regulator [candidate division Zixibacteria bacterium]HOD65258.1 response regulator [candidate division Zixibacteria bacterium]HOZ07311.1 response regulator [candidate division Zixibacteria bacterium]